MPGSEWNQLVAAPSATEIDAALADVRVRAVPIARRRARNRRLMSYVVFAGLAGGVFYVGSLAGGNGITLGAQAQWNRNGFPGAPELAREEAPHAAAVPVDSTVWTWRITSWQELDGYKFGQNVMYAQGPAGTSFGIAIADDDNHRRMTGLVSAANLGEEVALRLQSFTRQQIGTSRRGLDVYEEGNAGIEQRMTRGASMLMYPFGHRPGSADEPVYVVRIEGPDVVAPANVLWDTTVTRSFTYGSYLSETFASVIRFNQPFLDMARRVGARVTYAPISKVILVPFYTPPKPHLLFSLMGSSAGAAEYNGPMMQRLHVPGTESLYQVSASWYNSWREGEEGNLCVTMRPTNTNRGLRDDKWWGNCFRASDDFAPIRIVTPRREALRVELLNKPPRARF